MATCCFCINGTKYEMRAICVYDCILALWVFYLGINYGYSIVDNLLFVSYILIRIISYVIMVVDDYSTWTRWVQFSTTIVKTGVAIKFVVDWSIAISKNIEALSGDAEADYIAGAMPTVVAACGIVITELYLCYITGNLAVNGANATAQATYERELELSDSGIFLYVAAEKKRASV